MVLVYILIVVLSVILWVAIGRKICYWVWDFCNGLVTPPVSKSKEGQQCESTKMKKG